MRSDGCVVSRDRTGYLLYYWYGCPLVLEGTWTYNTRRGIWLWPTLDISQGRFGDYSQGMCFRRFRVLYLQLQCAFGFQLLYNLAITSIKWSILLFFHRTFHPHYFFRVVNWCVAGFVTCWFITVTFGVIFQCTPLSFLWNKNQPGHCIDFEVLSISTAIVNIVTDCIIVGMPMPIIWKLQLPMTKKIGLSFTFLLGGIVILASILRVTTLHSVNTYDSSCRSASSAKLPWANQIYHR